MVLIISAALLLLLYAVLLFYFWRSWTNIPVFDAADFKAGTFISVIVAARNEEENIPVLLAALEKQTYPRPLFEVIVVDDHSDDDTKEKVRAFTWVRLIPLLHDRINSYKKKAIETGIANANGTLIVTTDADCEPGPQWLATIAAFKEKHASKFIAAPVLMSGDHSLLQVFQTMDFLVLQGITGAAVAGNSLSMCNGANLAYEKKAFNDVNGFAGIDTIASGDDMLLMHKISMRFPGSTNYLKAQSAIVATAPMKSWRGFLNQRIRWASKARFYTDKRIMLVLALVYAVNLLFPVLLVAGIFSPKYLLYALVLWLVKTLVEWPFFISVSRFFHKTKLAGLFFFFQPLHMLYTVVAGLLGQLGKYEWKGRKVK